MARHANSSHGWRLSGADWLREDRRLRQEIHRNQLNTVASHSMSKNSTFRWRRAAVKNFGSHFLLCVATPTESIRATCSGRIAMRKTTCAVSNG